MWLTMKLWCITLNVPYCVVLYLVNNFSLIIVRLTTWFKDENKQTATGLAYMPKTSDAKLIDALKVKAKEDSRFQFTGKEYPGMGLYITSIGGVAEDNVN